MKKSKKQAVVEESIITVLTKAGWKKTVKGEAFGKAEMEHSNSSVTLEVAPSWKPGWLNFSVYDRSEQGSDFTFHCPKAARTAGRNSVLSGQDNVR